MIRHSILLLIAVLLCSTLMSAYAQDGVPPAAQSLIDSALTILDMTKRDCAMRHDAVTVDPFRLQLMKDVFAQPFKLCSTTVAHTSFLKKYAGDEFDLYAARIMRDMQFGTYKPMLLDDDAAYTKTAITIRTPFGATVQRADFENNLTYQAIIRRYFVPLFQAAKLIGQTRDAFLRDSIIIRNCDSLLMMSEDDGNASVYALKAAEREADATSRMYFDNAALHSVSTVSSVSLSLYTQIMSHIPVTRAAYSVFYDSLRSVVIETPYGRIAIGGKGDDIYEGEYFLIFDIGGNDKYFLYSSKNSALSYPVRAIVDFGGNDMYVGNGYSIAAGIAGCGLLIDVAGNDTYDGGSFSLGSGLWGVGILHDMSGTDRYNGGVFSQAAGAFGIGMLIDAKGNDSYSVQANGQAFASVKGFGLLCDQSGNDIYTTQSPFVDVLRYDSHFVSFTQGAALGHRPIASGGIALLYDVSGNDNYISDIYGQATSYWFGIGALVDDDGEDRYSSYQYAQGAGIHFAHALLWDAKGDDTYVSHGVSQGCGHDVGFGFLLDESGDDSYIAESLSLGGGNANAVSILCDVRGNDSYIARNLTNCFGFSDFRRTYGMIGIFADGGGNDMYGNTARNSTVELKSYYGVFLDNPAPATETQKATSGTTPPALVLASTLDSLFVQASAAAQKYQYMVTPARDELIRRREETLPFLAGKLGTTQPRERLALEYIIPKLYAADTMGVTKLIGDSLGSQKIETQLFSLWAFGKCKMAVLAPKLSPLLRDNDWRIRAAAAQQIGEAKVATLAPVLAKLLVDTVANVRMRSAYTIVQTLPQEAASLLKPVYKDVSQLVRNAIAMGLATHAPIKPELFSLYLNAIPNERILLSLMRVLPSLDSTQPLNETLGIVAGLDELSRETAYRTLIAAPQPFWKRTLAAMLAIEQNPDIKQRYAAYSVPPPATVAPDDTPAPGTIPLKQRRKLR